MSEIKDDVLVINTEQKIETKKEVDTFQLVDPNHPMIWTMLKEFDFENSPVNPNDFASTLVETCKKHKGLGLSANQCGFPHRVFVMGANDDFIACFNPKVILAEEETHMVEGCLSFPLLELRITRPKTITVEYQDWTGKVHNAKFTGLSARIFLHELDHLNGIVYTSRCKPLALKSGMKKVEKTYRKYFNPRMMKQIANGNQKTNP